MSFFGADPSAIIDHIGSAIGSLAPAPAPQGPNAAFGPGQGPGSGGFAPAPMVAGSNAWPTVTIGGGGFQPAQIQGGSFQPSGGIGGGFQPSAGVGGGFQPSGGIGGSPFQPSAQNPLLAPKAPTTTGTAPGASGGPSAGMSPGVAKWAGQAQQTFGDLLDPDIMLAIMQNESGGDPNAYNAAGNAYGLFQQLNLGSNDPNVQFAAARKLAEEKMAGINAAYAKNGLNPDARTKALDFAAAWAGHFDYNSGKFNPNSYDPGVNQTAQQWAQVFLGNYDKIKAGRAQGGAGIPAGPALQTIFGGQQPPSVMQEFGVTDYSQAHPDTYAYGNAYGLQGSQHPGVDYGMPLGSKLYVPVGGTVSVVGNDHGSGYYYTSPMTGGDPDHSGELAITLDNGDIVILGHMGSINLQVGQRVNAGDFAGLSGGSDGAHLHLEVRQRSNQTSSGYQIVDPRIYFGGR